MIANLILEIILYIAADFFLKSVETQPSHSRFQHDIVDDLKFCEHS